MKEYRKAIVAGVGFLVNLLSVLLTVGGILPAVALPYVSVVLLLAATYGVYAVRNVEKPKVMP